MSELKYSILVADDQANIIQTTIDLLKQIAKEHNQAQTDSAKKVDLRISPAISGIDVLNTLATAPIDALFLDYHFPGGLNGYEVIKRINDPFGVMLIILMSNHNPQELEPVLVKGYQNLGSRFRFLRKEFERSELMSKFYEIENHVFSRPYPFPLASAMNMVKHSPTAQGRLTAMRDLVEAVVKYAVIIFLSDLSRLGMAKGFQPDIQWTSNLTLGSWLRLLERLLKHLAGNKDSLFMSELYDFCLKNNKKTKNLEFLYRFKDDLRDPIIGHGLTLEEGAYDRLSSIYEKDIQWLYDSCRFMQKYHLVSVEQSDYIEDLGIDDYRVRVLMGKNLNFDAIQWKSRNRLQRRRVYLRRWDDDVLPLYPFLLFTTCDSCRMERLFSLDNILDQEIEFLSSCNHRLRDSHAREKFNSILNLRSSDR